MTDYNGFLPWKSLKSGFFIFLGRRKSIHENSLLNLLVFGKRLARCLHEGKWRKLRLARRRNLLVAVSSQFTPLTTTRYRNHL